MVGIKRYEGFAMKTGYLWDDGYLGHFTSTIHPESPARVEGITFEKMSGHLPGIVPVRVDPGLGRPWVMRVHTAEYVERVASAFEKRVRTMDNGDTLVREDTYDTALRAVSGALSLLREIANGSVDNGFAALRPPGHHAGKSHARGFCYFNNAAICAKYAQAILKWKRVLIVDWDVHPADGTSGIFYDDPDVHVFSVHQHGIFSTSVGLAEHRGVGEGEGATHHVPLPPGTEELAYLRAFEPALQKAAAACKPDLIIISAGFDAHAGDPIGGLRLQDETYTRLTQMVANVAKDQGHTRILSLLEGGYSPPVVTRCVRTHVGSLLDM